MRSENRLWTLWIQWGTSRLSEPIYFQDTRKGYRFIIFKIHFKFWFFEISILADFLIWNRGIIMGSWNNIISKVRIIITYVMSGLHGLLLSNFRTTPDTPDHLRIPHFWTCSSVSSFDRFFLKMIIKPIISEKIRLIECLGKVINVNITSSEIKIIKMRQKSILIIAIHQNYAIISYRHQFRKSETAYFWL